MFLILYEELFFANSVTIWTNSTYRRLMHAELFSLKDADASMFAVVDLLYGETVYKKYQTN